jgi:3'(2'), 5'-bisphosphate nucleotidase
LKPERGIVIQNSEPAGRDLLDDLTLIASRAAAVILAVPSPDLNQREKKDKSPVTAADEASEATILEGLARLRPGIPIVSEELAERHASGVPGQRFFMVDPLDGTREFLASRDEFTVNIALIDGGVPVAGVIAAPARGLIWRGQFPGGQAKGQAERLALAPGAGLDSIRGRTAIHTRKRPSHGPHVLLSRSHLDAATTAYVDRLPHPERIVSGSAIKFCLLAEGAADLYPRLAPTSEWDVAAGHALLLAAGGNVVLPDGTALRYGRKDYRIPAFIAVGDPSAVLPT